MLQSIEMCCCCPQSKVLCTKYMYSRYCMNRLVLLDCVSSEFRRIPSNSALPHAAQCKMVRVLVSASQCCRLLNLMETAHARERFECNARRVARSAQYSLEYIVLTAFGLASSQQQQPPSPTTWFTRWSEIKTAHTNEHTHTHPKTTRVVCDTQLGQCQSAYTAHEVSPTRMWIQ